jgi:hypothetical protein
MLTEEVIWAADIGVSVLGHLIDQPFMILLAAGVYGTFSHHMRTSVSFAIIACWTVAEVHTTKRYVIQGISSR